MRLKLVSILTISLGFFVSTASVSAPDQPSAKDLQKLRQEIQSAQQRINQKQGEENSLSNTLRKTELNLSKVESKIYSLKKDINQQQRQLNKLHSEETQLNQQKTKQETQIIDQINTSFRLGREKKIKVLLNQEDPQKLSRSLIYADYFNRARIESIDEYQQTLDEINTLTSSIENKTAALLKNKNSLVTEQKQLKVSYKKRNTALTKLKSSISSDKNKLEQLQIEQQQLQELLQAVEITIDNIKLPSDSTPFAKTKGKLPWPTKGQMKNRYGRKKPPSNLRWEGISFYANSGKNINAAHHGRIVFADWFKGKGLLLIIDHGDGYMTLYAHNQTLLRETGDWVSAGETIATLGNSGGLDHTELYFEIRHQGKPVNPKYWLKKHG